MEQTPNTVQPYRPTPQPIASCGCPAGTCVAEQMAVAIAQRIARRPPSSAVVYLAERSDLERLQREMRHKQALCHGAMALKP